MTDNTKNCKGIDCLTLDEIEQREDNIAKGLFSGVCNPLGEYLGKCSVSEEQD